MALFKQSFCLWGCGSCFWSLGTGWVAQLGSRCNATASPPDLTVGTSRPGGVGPEEGRRVRDMTPGPCQPLHHLLARSVPSALACQQAFWRHQWPSRQAPWPRPCSGSPVPQP